MNSHSIPIDLILQILSRLPAKSVAMILSRLPAKSSYTTLCFELRSEKFTFINVERFCQLVNHKGKLAMIFWEDDNDTFLENDLDADTVIELHVWVQEDVEKQEWSKYAYTLSDDKFFSRRFVSVAGVTDWGEVVFAMSGYTSEEPFYVFYFNPEKNTLRRVEVKGIFGMSEKLRSVWTFVNHVEDLNVNDLKLLKTVHAPFVKSAEDDWID